MHAGNAQMLPATNLFAGIQFLNSNRLLPERVSVYNYQGAKVNRSVQPLILEGYRTK